MKYSLPILMLVTVLFLAACSQPATPDRTDPPPAQGKPPETASPAPPQPAPAPEKPLAITGISVPEARVIGPNTFMLPMSAPLTVKVTATGAKQVTLHLRRYGSSPPTAPFFPTSVEGDVYSFPLSLVGHRRVMLDLTATREGKPAVGEKGHLYYLNPQYTQFTTVARGTAKGWDPAREADVRSLFKEDRVLRLRDGAQVTALAAQFRSLLGVELPAVDLQGQEILAVLGAPADGPRQFEVLELNRATPGSVSLGILYEAKPGKAGPPEVSYHIIRADLSAYKDLAELPVTLYSVPDLTKFQTQTN